MESFQSKEAKNLLNLLQNPSLENQRIVFQTLQEDGDLAFLFKDALVVFFYFEKPYRLKHRTRQILKAHDLWSLVGTSHVFLSLSNHIEANLEYRQQLVDKYFETYLPHRQLCEYFIYMNSSYTKTYDVMLDDLHLY